jgi:hypothetical protein
VEKSRFVDEPRLINVGVKSTINERDTTGSSFRTASRFTCPTAAW